MRFLITLSCIVTFFELANGAFDEVPISYEVISGEEAVFTCQHQTADIIRWKVNGSLVETNSTDITLATIYGSLETVNQYILTIVARVEYNGSMVVCVAQFNDGAADEQTQPALLFVNKNCFLISPHSLNVTKDVMAVFRCQHQNADGINWRINGSILGSFPDGIGSERSNDGIFTLTITALLKYNQTEVVCVALFTSPPSEETAAAILMIQGDLVGISNIVSSNITTISWIPPFSLDLTGVDPDIVYCVEVFNITCGRRDLIINDCNVTVPSYTSDDIALDRYIYEYIVTPRINVPGATNGTPSQPLKDRFAKLVLYSSLIDNISNHSRTYQMVLTVNEINLPIPSTYTLLLQSLDGLENIHLVHINTTVSIHIITLDVFPDLPLRRLWNYSILAYGCEVVIGDIELSTHDIQNISLSSTLPGQVRVTGDFIQGSTATGVLGIFVIDERVHYYSMVPNIDELGTQHIDDVVSGLAGGQNIVSLFVIDKNGIPFKRVATRPRLITIVENSEKLVTQIHIKYELHSTSSGSCISCTFLDSSTRTDCVAVVHQRISQLSSSGLMNIESSYKFTRFGDTAYGCIDSETNLENYQLGVIDGNHVAGTTHIQRVSCFVAGIWCTTSTVLGIITVLIFILIISILGFCIFNRRVCKQASGLNSSPQVTVDMKHCAAYEVTTLAKQRVDMNLNPAYEQVQLYENVLS